MQRIRLVKAISKCGGQKLFTTKVDVLTEKIRSAGVSAIDHEVDTKTFDKAVWKVVKTKDYESVTKLFDNMGDDHHLHTKTSTNAAMTAYGMLRKTTKVKKLFLESPTAFTDSHSVYLLLHSYCVADRLDMAEYFMNDCLEKYVKQSPSDKAAATLLTQLYQSKEKNLNSSKLKSKEFQEFGDVQFQTLLQNKIVPLYVWSTLIRLYSGRNAWVQCLQILEYIESSGLYKVESPSSSSSVTLADGLAPEEQSSESQLQLAEQSVAEKNLDLMEDFSHLVSEDSVAMQHSILYHHTIRALCVSSQYTKVLDILASMRKRGIQPQISAIIHMLSVFTCSTPSNTLNITYHNYAQLGEVVLALKPDILLSVHKLGREFSKEVVAANGAGTVYTHTANYQTAAALTVEYVTVLSKVSQTAVAEQFVQFIRYEYPPLLTSQLVTPLIERYKQLGQWQKAQSIFVLLSSSVMAPVAQHMAKQSMAYHHVTESMRKSHKVNEMAQFMDTNNVDDNSSTITRTSFVSPPVVTKTSPHSDSGSVDSAPVDKTTATISANETVERPKGWAESASSVVSEWIGGKQQTPAVEK